MTTFGQWLHSSAKPNAKISRVTWICGKEIVLVEEIVDHIRTVLAPSPANMARLRGGKDNVWAYANQFTLDSKSLNRLILVRDSQNIETWSKLETWFATIRKHSYIYLVFVADEPNPYLYESGRVVLNDKGSKVLKPHLALMQKNTTLTEIISCNGLRTDPPRDKRGVQTRPADAVTWLQKWCEVSELTGLYLMERVGGDLGKAKDVCLKASLFGRALTQVAIDALVDETVGDIFVSSLIKMKKDKAVLSIPTIPVERYSQIVGSLDYHLDIVGVLHNYHREFKTMKHVAQDNRVPTVVALEFWEVAKLWDAGRRRAAREALAAVDGALSAQRAAARGDWASGLLEALVALW